MAKNKNKNRRGSGGRTAPRAPQRATPVPAPLGPSGTGAVPAAAPIAAPATSPLQEPDATLEAQGLPEGVTLPTGAVVGEPKRSDLPWFLLVTVADDMDANTTMGDWGGYAMASLQGGATPEAAAANADRMMHMHLERLSLLMTNLDGEDDDAEPDVAPQPVTEAPAAPPRDALDSPG